MTIKADLQIRSILEMTERMLVLSEQGFACCEDDGCLLLNGMVRECAYRIRDAVEREKVIRAGNAAGMPQAALPVAGTRGTAGGKIRMIAKKTKAR